MGCVFIRVILRKKFNESSSVCTGPIVVKLVDRCIKSENDIILSYSVNILSFFEYPRNLFAIKS